MSVIKEIDYRYYLLSTIGSNTQGKYSQSWGHKAPLCKGLGAAFLIPLICSSIGFSIGKDQPNIDQIVYTPLMIELIALPDTAPDNFWTKQESEAVVGYLAS